MNTEIEGLLTDLDNSCASAAVAVADHIRTVAENGPEYSTPQALRAEAEELEGWAKYLRERITVNGLDGTGRGVPLVPL